MAEKNKVGACPVGKCPSPSICKGLSEHMGKETCAAKLLSQPAPATKPGDRTAPMPKKKY